MSDELKSAIELALEKLNAQGDEPVQKLSQEQKEAIAETRRRFQAKIAEAEIGMQSRLKSALESGALEKIDELRNELSGEKERLTREMEREVEKVRRGEQN